MKAYFAANNYDLTSATEDWNAVTKWQTTVDSATFQRAIVAADSAQQYINGGTLPDGTVSPGMRNLAAQWHETNPVQALNAANVTAALNGAYGQSMQNIAQQMTTQLADLQADMASVYRYGLSSTDSSMENAGATLSTNWDEGQLDSSLDIISQNLQVRINSLKNPGNALSASGDSSNPYIGGSSGQPTTSTPTGTVSADSANW